MTTKTILALGSAALLLGSFASTQAQTPPGTVDFEKQVLPIFKERCFECHQKEYTDAKGKLKKPKGKFRMDNPELLLKGGEEGGSVTAGDPTKSTVYTSVTLPDSDDKAMPPKGDRLTAEQQEVIKKWIAEGASFGAWKGAEK